MRLPIMACGIAAAALATAPRAHAEPARVAFQSEAQLAAAERTDWLRPTGLGTGDVALLELTAALRDRYALPPSPAPAMPADAGAAPTSRFARAVIDRPAILPLGLAVVGASGSIGSAELAGVADALVGLPLGNDLGLGYRRGPIETGGQRLDASLGHRLRTLPALALATRTRLDLSLDGAVASRSLSGLRAALVLGRVAAWTRPEQLAVTLDGSRPPRLQLPVSLGAQLTSTAWVQIDADVPLADLYAAGASRPVATSLPMAAAALLSVTARLDLRAQVTADVDPAGVVGHSVRAAAGLGYRFGR